MRLRTLQDLEVKGKTVLLRAGFDVPLVAGKIENDFRIRDCLPTLDYLVKKRAKTLIIAHLGRPEGWDENFSLRPIAQHLAELLQRKFIAVPGSQMKLPDYSIPHLYFFEHNIEKVDMSVLVSQLQSGDIAVLENLRFYEGEQRNDPEFVRMLASLGSVYVNEAFSNSHRDHASMTGIAKSLPSAAGPQLQKEVQALTRALTHPKKPVVVMMGGIKLKDKAPALLNLAKIADTILLGGGLANLFLKIRGFEIGKSVWQEGKEENLAKELWRDYRDKIKLPLDVVVSHSREGEPECVKVHLVKPGQIILDIGPQTILEYSGYLKKGRTLIWSGPLGYIENRTYSHGTSALARIFASRSRGSAFGVAGGGETLEILGKLGLYEQIDNVSTGGGAMLEFLAGKSLPALEVLAHG